MQFLLFPLCGIKTYHTPSTLLCDRSKVLPTVRAHLSFHVSKFLLGFHYVGVIDCISDHGIEGSFQRSSPQSQTDYEVAQRHSPLIHDWFFWHDQPPI